MNGLKQVLKGMLIVMAGLSFTSCDNNEEIKVDPNANFDAVLEVNEGGPAEPNVNVTVNANTASTILAKVAFISTTVDMKRLYITQNIKGAEEKVFKPVENVDLKADGAVDLTGKNSKNFEFQFALPVPSGVGTDGSVVYKFWTTTGNGDFRDVSQRRALGPGTITLKYGTGTNPGSGTALVKSYASIQLGAPLADGTSNTFMSLLDGKQYNVKQGVEFVSLWDIGYLYSVTADAATLRAPFNYPDVAINIPVVAGTTNEELNKTYFKVSAKTPAEFDAITASSGLDFVTVTKTNANLVVTQLTANKVVEFVDNYGKKGLIKVLEVSGTNGVNGFIRIAVKVQP